MTCAKLLKASTEPTELPEAAAELIAATAGQLTFGELFGSRLAGVYAPPALASFGTGAARVDVRVVTPDGSARHRQALAVSAWVRQHRGVGGDRRVRRARPARAARQPIGRTGFRPRPAPGAASSCAIAPVAAFS